MATANDIRTRPAHTITDGAPSEDAAEVALDRAGDVAITAPVKAAALLRSVFYGLSKERMVVLGQMVEGTEVSDLKAGMEVELVLEKLYEDEASEYMVWKWKPVAA